MLNLSYLLSWLVWDPDRVAFKIPFFEHAVVWYGVLFALGFLVSYLIAGRIFFNEVFMQKKLQPEDIKDTQKLFDLCKKYPSLFKVKTLSLEAILPCLDKYIKAKRLPWKFFSSQIFYIRDFAMQMGDRLTTYLVVGVIIGARLGYVFFYGWPTFKTHPLEIIKIWEGGLASHGACAGILISLMLFCYRQPKKSFYFSFFHLLDLLAIISGAIAFFIRIGNFINQEIVGTFSQLPWAVVFMHPFGGEQGAIPRHPVQLYEAAFYLFLAFLTYKLWKKNIVRLGEGLMTGILLVLLFSFRFFIEFFKAHQGLVIDPQSHLQMGQILSLPFIVLGFGLIFRSYWLKKQQYKKSPL